MRFNFECILKLSNGLRTFLLLSYSHWTFPIVSVEGGFPSAIYLNPIRRRQGVSIPQGDFVGENGLSLSDWFLRCCFARAPHQLKGLRIYDMQVFIYMVCKRCNSYGSCIISSGKGLWSVNLLINGEFMFVVHDKLENPNPSWDKAWESALSN